jgi:hypothetical protein
VATYLDGIAVACAKRSLEEIKALGFRACLDTTPGSSWPMRPETCMLSPSTPLGSVVITCSTIEAHALVGASRCVG